MASWFLGHSPTTYTSSGIPLKFKTNNDQETSLLEFCKKTIPDCYLNPLLFNGHLQTAWTVRKGDDVPIYYKRKVFENEDPAYAGSFAVDFAVKPNEDHDEALPPRTSYLDDKEFESIGSTDSKPMLVALHGLSGGSYEIYLRHVLAPLISKEGGWEACVVNSRGCANSSITTGVLYNARATWDVRQTVRWLREKYPNRPLFGIGFSLGANILTNYVGEEGANCQLKAVVVVSNPWNLEVSSKALQRTWLGKEVYSKTMANNMKRLLASHRKMVEQDSRINMEEALKVNYLHEFDRAVQCPTWGYPTEDAYYRDATSTDSLLAIRIPFLGINAIDDPIAVGEAIPFEEFKQNPYTVLCTTPYGGHLSWFQLGGERWFAKAASAFFLQMGADINFDSLDSVKSKADSSISHVGKATYDPMRRRMYTPS